MSARFFQLVALLFPTLVILSAAPASALDVDADGVSDVAYVVPSKSTLQWRAQLSSNQALMTLSSLGKVGDHLIAANWDGHNANVGTVSASKSNGAIQWKLEASGGAAVASFTLGTVGDIAISGANFDGNPELDAATVGLTPDGKHWLWKIKLNPISDPNSVIVERVFGSSKTLPFFFSSDGSIDQLAVVSASNTGALTIQTRLISQKKVRKLKPSAALKLPRDVTPMPVRTAAGSDLLAFASPRGDGLQILFYNPGSARISPLSSPISGTLLVGDFDSGQAGQEVALARKDGMLISNPEVRSVNLKLHGETLSGAVFFDDININKIGATSADPAPTPRVPGVTPTQAPPRATPTAPTGFSNCQELTPRDGGGGFVWKPNSDTQYYAAAVLGPELSNVIARVDTFSTGGQYINNMYGKGIGNGGRTAWQDRKYTGGSYASQFGQIVLVGSAYDGSCRRWLIDTPSRRID